MVEREHAKATEQSPQPTGPTDTTDTDRIPAQTAPGAPTTPEPTPTPPAASHPEVRRMRRTRISGVWVGITLSALVLLVLLVFIIENGATVDIAFFGAHGRLPLGVALLLAAICGVLLVAVPGYGRIIQLRRAVKRVAGSVPARRRR